MLNMENWSFWGKSKKIKEKSVFLSTWKYPTKTHELSMINLQLYPVKMLSWLSTFVPQICWPFRKLVFSFLFRIYVFNLISSSKTYKFNTKVKTKEKEGGSKQLVYNRPNSRHWSQVAKVDSYIVS